MKLTLLLLINILIPNTMSQWIDLNKDIIDSKLYQVSFDQKFESMIGGSAHYISDTCRVIYYKNKIKYESSDKIIIIDKDSLKMLNKHTNQLFIDNVDNRYNMLLHSSLLDILIESEFVSSVDSDYYYIKYDNTTGLKIYLSNNYISMIEISYDNFKAKLSNIKLSPIDTAYTLSYFTIDNDSLDIFDLRIK